MVSTPPVRQEAVGQRHACGEGKLELEARDGLGVAHIHGHHYAAAFARFGIRQGQVIVRSGWQWLYATEVSPRISGLVGGKHGFGNIQDCICDGSILK